MILHAENQKYFYWDFKKWKKKKRRGGERGRGRERGVGGEKEWERGKGKRN